MITFQLIQISFIKPTKKKIILYDGEMVCPMAPIINTKKKKIWKLYVSGCVY